MNRQNTMSGGPRRPYAFLPAALSTVALLLLAACALQPTAYAPAASEGGEGYSEQQIQADRFRVRFTGNEVTSRAMVEDYLLLRAAQLTLANGRSHFRFLDQDIALEEDQELVYLPAGTGFHRASGFFRPVIAQSRTTREYLASAQFRTLDSGDNPDDASLFNARQVVDLLQPITRGQSAGQIADRAPAGQPQAPR